MKQETKAGAAFTTTRWTEVLQAALPGPGRDEAAFASLYTAYWFPLYSFARRQGLSPADAEDIVQGFFTHLISNEALAALQREGGRFRSFMLKSLENFIHVEWRRQRAQKRGGGQRLLSLNAENGEARFALDAADAETPALAFEKRWVLTMLERVTARLRDDYARSGREELCARLIKHLQPDRSGEAYAAEAAECGMSEGAFKVAVHRLRRRYGELLREEIAGTVASAADVEEELRHLINVVGR
jgi:RNA polymerase sigma-70 factor (ECF subfamily)